MTYRMLFLILCLMTASTAHAERYSSYGEAFFVGALQGLFLMFVLGIYKFIKNNKSKSKENRPTKGANNVNNSPHTKLPPLEIYNIEHATITRDLEALTNENLQYLSEKDIFEKIATLKRMSKQYDCSIPELKDVTINTFVSQFTAEELHDVVDRLAIKAEIESREYGISQKNTMSHYVRLWLIDYLSNTSLSNTHNLRILPILIILILVVALCLSACSSNGQKLGYESYEPLAKGDTIMTTEIYNNDSTEGLEISDIPDNNILPEIYSNSKFSIRYPWDWYVVQENVRATDNTTIAVHIMQRETNELDFRPNINVIVSKDKHSETTYSLARISYNQAREEGFATRLIGINDCQINGNKGSVAEYVAMIEDYSLHIYQYIVKKKTIPQLSLL